MSGCHIPDISIGEEHEKELHEAIRKYLRFGWTRNIVDCCYTFCINFEKKEDEFIFLTLPSLFILNEEIEETTSFKESLNDIRSHEERDVLEKVNDNLNTWNVYFNKNKAQAESLNDIREEEDYPVSPIAKEIQILHENYRGLFHDISHLEKLEKELMDKFQKLEERINEIQSEQGEWKLAIKGDIVSLNDSVLAVEKGLENYREYRTDIEDLGTDVMYIKERLDKLESSKLTEELDPKVWVFVNERLDRLESMVSKLDLIIKAKEFGMQMEEGNRYMECLSGLENKLQSQIDEAKAQFMSIYGKRPHKCPVC